MAVSISGGRDLDLDWLAGFQRFYVRLYVFLLPVASNVYGSYNEFCAWLNVWYDLYCLT